MEWWRWLAAAGAALFVLAVLAVRFDTLKDVPGATAATALRTLAPYAATVPAVFLLALFGPWWLAAAVVAVPGVVLLLIFASG